MSAAQKQPVKAAFEIKKGIRQVMTLSEMEVEKYLNLQELLDGLEDGFRGLELGEVQSPPRTQLSVAGKGFSLAMPAWRQGMQMTVKIVNVFDANLDVDLPNHLAPINLFDPNTGATSCIMDGTYITGIRTAAFCGSFSPHAEPERIADRYGDRGRRAREWASATAPVDSGFRTDQYLLVTLRRRSEACGSDQNRACNCQRGSGRARVGCRVSGDSFSYACDQARLGKTGYPCVFRSLLSSKWRTPERSGRRASALCRNAGRFSADSGRLRRTCGPECLRGNDSRSSGSGSQ